MKENIKIGTKITLKKSMGFLDKIGKEYIISDVDKKNQTIYFSVPFTDYSSHFFKEVNNDFQFKGMLTCTASISFDELEKYFIIPIDETSKEWGYCDDNGTIITTKNRWSKWLYYNADFIYNSIYDDSSTIAKCKYRISRDGRIQMRSIDFANYDLNVEFQSVLRRKEKTYFASSYAICNKKYDHFNRDLGLNIAKMRMRVKLAKLESDFILQRLQGEN